MMNMGMIDYYQKLNKGSLSDTSIKESLQKPLFEFGRFFNYIL